MGCCIYSRISTLFLTHLESNTQSRFQKKVLQWKIFLLKWNTAEIPHTQYQPTHKSWAHFWEWPHHWAERGTLVKALIILQNEVQKRAGYWNSYLIFCTSDMLGKETIILPGGCKAKHNTHMLAVHTGRGALLLLACSLLIDSSFRTKHWFSVQEIKPDIKKSTGKQHNKKNVPLWPDSIALIMLEAGS